MKHGVDRRMAVESNSNGSRIAVVTMPNAAIRIWCTVIATNDQRLRWGNWAMAAQPPTQLGGTMKSPLRWKWKQELNQNGTQ